MAKRFLVIGASGVAGGAGVRVARELYPDAEIFGVWFGRPQDEEPVAGVDELLCCDIAEDTAPEQIAARFGRQFDWCLFATAKGEVGLPKEEVTEQQIAEATRASFSPLPALEAALQIGTSVAYSAFFRLRHPDAFYGAMAYAKEALEVWVTESEGRRCIRAGMFTSKSSRGIELLMRRKARISGEWDNKLLNNYFTGRTHAQAMEAIRKAIADEERARFGDTNTDQRSLEAAHRRLFAGVDRPFVNVCGSRLWLSTTPQRIGVEPDFGERDSAD